METIFAVSSGPPPAAIALLRISGRQARAAAIALAGPLPADRRATLRPLRDPADGTLLDRSLMLVFSAPDTATGEDIVELHLHGGRAVVAAVERVLATLPGLRQAEPGEFTRRALANGRIDLTEAEGLGDLLSAETEHQRRMALLAAEGGVRRRIDGWSQRILALSAQIEAELDFAEEDDVPEQELDRARCEAAVLAHDIGAVLAQPPIERLHDGIRIVLAGPPNSGKSTLLNAMTAREAAIVSPIAGTTRDRIDIAIQRNGIAYVLTDTAGLASTTDDPIERIGIERARVAMATADLILWLGDDPPPCPALHLHARADEVGREECPVYCDVAVSGMSALGLDALWQAIERRAATLLPRLDGIAFNRRQRDLIETVASSLTRASTANDVLLLAEELRHARHALDRITGSSDTEAMLDGLFGKFCLGK